MLKNMKLGTKIGGGFGILILIAMLLGGVAVWNMKRVGTVADSLQSEIAPSVDIGVRVERSSLLTMYAMRAFNYTGDDKDYAEAEKNVADVEKALAEATALAQKHDMAKLKADAAKATAKVAEYRAIMKQGKDLDTVSDANLLTMNTTAPVFMKACYEYLESQNKLMSSDLSGKVDARKIRERLDKISWINEVVDLGNGARIGNFKSQAARDPKFALEIMKNFDEIDKKIEQIRAITHVDKDLKDLDVIKAAGHDYQKAVQEFLKIAGEKEQLNTKRRAVAAEVVAAATPKPEVDPEIALEQERKRRVEQERVERREREGEARSPERHESAPVREPGPPHLPPAPRPPLPGARGRSTISAAADGDGAVRHERAGRLSPRRGAASARDRRVEHERPRPLVEQAAHVDAVRRVHPQGVGVPLPGGIVARRVVVDRVADVARRLRRARARRALPRVDPAGPGLHRHRRPAHGARVRAVACDARRAVVRRRAAGNAHVRPGAPGSRALVAAHVELVRPARLVQRGGRGRARAVVRRLGLGREPARPHVAHEELVGERRLVARAVGEQRRLVLRVTEEVRAARGPVPARDRGRGALHARDASARARAARRRAGRSVVERYRLRAVGARRRSTRGPRPVEHAEQPGPP